MKRKILGLLIVVLGLALAVYFFKNKNQSSIITPAETPVITSTGSTTDTSVKISTSTKQNTSTTTTKNNQSQTVTKSADNQVWKRYSYNNFSIQFPEEPRLIDESDIFNEYKTYYSIQTDSTTYFIDESDVPKEMVGTTTLQTLMNVASIVINQAKQSAEVNLDYAIDLTNEIGYPSIEFSLSISDGPRKLFGQYILLGDKMYQMRVVTTVKSEKNAQYRRFFESFTPKR